MQKEVKYQLSGKSNLSDYQEKNIAVYDIEMVEDDVRQMKKLTQDSLTFNIDQMNINFCMSFNENFDIEITYEPIKIYDLSQLISGYQGTQDSTDPAPTYMKDIDGNLVYTDSGMTQKVGVERMYNIGLSISNTYIRTVTPKTHRFSLQQQSINELLNNLNYPLKHIPYTTQAIIKQGDGFAYNTWLTGEIDVSGQIFWDVYNGKLRFNYTGLNPNVDQKENWVELYCAQGDYPDNLLGTYPLPPATQADINPVQFQKRNACTFNYAYTASYIDTYNPGNIHQTGSMQSIYVAQLDSNISNHIFTINNFYYANQLLGLMQFDNKIIDFINNYQYGNTETFQPQTSIGNYNLEIVMNNNDGNYLKNLKSKFILTAIPDPQYQYIDRVVVLSQEFFLQIFREIYCLMPRLQTNNIIYKEQTGILKRQIQFTDELNICLQSFKIRNIKDYYYQSDDNMSIIAYYVNSVSFNNYVSLKNTYPLSYNQIDQSYEIESLKNIRIVLVDENGMILPRLNEFKVYLQFKQQSDNETAPRTTNFNRVINN